MVPQAQDVEWSTPKERELAKNRQYTANYRIGSDSAFSRFDFKGNWVMTISFMKVADLPETVTSSIKSEYMNAKFLMAAHLEEPGFDGYAVAYTFKEDRWTVQISKEGKIVRRKVQGEGFDFD
jgi:hypothetical protein